MLNIIMELWKPCAAKLKSVWLTRRLISVGSNRGEANESLHTCTDQRHKAAVIHIAKQPQYVYMDACDMQKHLCF